MKLGFNKMFVVDCVGRSDGLTLLSNNEIDVKIHNYSHWHINATIKTNGATSASGWKLTGTDNSLKVFILSIKVNIIIPYYDLILAFYI
jgi:hypothetical protein